MGLTPVLELSSQIRPIPSSGFNQDSGRNEIQPLQRWRVPEMDDSYVSLWLPASLFVLSRLGPEVASDMEVDTDLLD